jgi:hypothetical protein
MRHLGESILNGYLDDTLRPAEQLAASVHLDGCPACRSRLESLRSLARTLAGLPEEPLRRDLARAVLSALPRTKPAAGWRLAAAAAAGLALGLLMVRSGQVDRSVQALARLAAPPGLEIPTLQLPELALPQFQLPAIRLPDLALPRLEAPNAQLLVLAASAAALGVVGNALLLRPRRPSARRSHP